jgi:hypothetical protein
LFRPEIHETGACILCPDRSAGPVRGAMGFVSHAGGQGLIAFAPAYLKA